MSDQRKELLSKSNEFSYLPAQVTAPVLYDSGSAEIAINNERYPVLDTAFNMVLIQKGTEIAMPEKKDFIGQYWIQYSTKPAADDCFKELYLLPVSVLGYSRSKFATFNRKETSAKPLCSSRDGLVPNIDAVGVPECDRCAEIVMESYGPRLRAVCDSAKKGPNGEQAACRLTEIVSFLILPDAVPVRMFLRGSGLRAFIDFQKSYRRALNIARIKRRPLSSFVVHATVGEESTYVYPVFEFVQAPEEFGDVSAYLQLAAYYRDNLFALAADATDEDKPLKAVESESEVSDDGNTVAAEADFEI